MVATRARIKILHVVQRDRGKKRDGNRRIRGGHIGSRKLADASDSGSSTSRQDSDNGEGF